MDMKKLSVKNGFTLVELLVAATLIMSVFGSILALVNYSIYAMSFIRNNLVASFLAQEGIELVIKKRGENWIAGENFNLGLDPGIYEADYVDGLEKLPDLSEQRSLNFDENFGYQYGSGQVTDFMRLISVSEVSIDHLKISSVVSWKSRNKDFSIVVEDHLYNWF